MTYIATEVVWLYLAVVIDALEMDCLQRRPRADEANSHSDRGNQYASDDCREVMKMYGLIASMSRKAKIYAQSNPSNTQT